MTSPNSSAPVSAWLEQKLLAQLNEKKIVVWLDADGAYTGFVDGLRRRSEAKDFPAPVLAYRGSFLELMLELETEGSTIDKPPLLFHLPGFNKETVRRTPLLEMYECAHAWEVNLATLVGEAANGRLPLPEIEAFVKAPGLSLASADEWLARAGGVSVDTHAEWVSRLEPTELINHLTGTSTWPDGIDRALRARAEMLFGTDPAWLAWFDESETTEAVVAWLLCVEFVHDLRRPPRHPQLGRLKSLPPPTVKRCQAEAARLRQQLPERYRAWALGVEARVKDAEKTEPRDLGRIDTFQFEALTIYTGAVEALARGDYRQVLEWFDAHEASQGFWIQQEQGRRWAWTLLGEAAKLGVALLKAPRPLEGVASLDEAVQRYSEVAASVDRAHRRFEQRHSALFGPMLPDQLELSEAFEKLRFAWSDWADRLARDFARICRDAGPLPPSELQQRTLFDQVVAPLLGQGERVALFVLDALRFEMALELREELAGSGVVVDLKARMAELPTITRVGMNALAPVARAGRLTPVIKAGRFEGFRTGEATVSGPEDRKKAITARAGGRHPIYLKLDEVLHQTGTSTLKNRVAQTQLVVVHALEFDEAGEAGFGVRVFEDILRSVIAAKHQLETAGVQHFVFTSDHGFLLQRGTASPRPFGSRGEADRRYAWSEVDRSDAGHLTVPLNALGYEAPGYLVFREDTLEFDVGRPSGSFTHGGNSLQERVIPVLQVSRHRALAQTGVRFAIQCEKASPALGVQRVRLKVTPAPEPGQAPLQFARSQPVDLAARVPGRPDVPVVIKDVIGPNASAHAGGIRVDAATSDWTEVYFALEGRLDERLPVEFFIPGPGETTASPDATYPVTFVRSVEHSTPAAPTPTLIIKEAGGWAQRLGDADAGKVFDYLEEHGSLSEAELNSLLGTPRKARQFAARFDGFLDRLTFEVEVSVGPEGKRYQRVA